MLEGVLSTKRNNLCIQLYLRMSQSGVVKAANSLSILEAHKSHFLNQLEQLRALGLPQSHAAEESIPLGHWPGFKPGIFENKRR